MVILDFNLGEAKQRHSTAVVLTRLILVKVRIMSESNAYICPFGRGDGGGLVSFFPSPKPTQSLKLGIKNSHKMLRKSVLSLFSFFLREAQIMNSGMSSLLEQRSQPQNIGGEGGGFPLAKPTFK